MLTILVTAAVVGLLFSNVLAWALCRAMARGDAAAERQAGVRQSEGE